jgi:cytochrome c553
MAKRSARLIVPTLAALVAATAARAAAPPPAAPAARTAAVQTAAAPQAAPAAAPAAPSGPPAVTPDPYSDGSVQAGAAQATMCFACHGPDGNSVSPAFPRLAGQSAVYIAEQLRLFRGGIRQNPMMTAMAAGLSDQAIDNLAVFFSAQTPSGLEADPTLWQAGQALYLSGDRKHDVPACAACHGPTGQGNPAAGYPALRAQQSAYVVTQLQSYANDTRYSGPHADTATPNSIMMFTIAKRLSPAQMQAVASYVQGLR